MDLRQIKEVIKESEGAIEEKKGTLISNLTNDHPNPHQQIDTGSALQLFLDHIPISAIPGIKNSPVVELKTGDSVRDAIHMLYEKNVYGAPIADVMDSDATAGRFSDRYVGFIDIATILLWSLEECEKAQIPSKEDGTDEISNNGFFFMLEQNPQICQTKVGELAKSFLLDPFLPVTFNDTLFHVLLLLSKHRLQVVPVIEQTNSQVIGFVTQSMPFVYLESGDQSIAEAIDILSKNRIGAIAVVNRGTKKVIGSMRSSDILLLLENDNLFDNREKLTVEELIRVDASKNAADSNSGIEPDLGALLSAGIPSLRNSSLPRMDSPVTNRKTDSLKEAMRKLAKAKENFSFFVDEMQRATGLLELRDIIIQFAPPCIDSKIDGGGFFESALEQAGCHVENGTVICDH